MRVTDCQQGHKMLFPWTKLSDRNALSWEDVLLRSTIQAHMLKIRAKVVRQMLWLIIEQDLGQLIFLQYNKKV